VSRQVFLYDPPERFVAGTVGLPGRRTVFLQASAGGRTTTVALEKTQVAALAVSWWDGVLTALRARELERRGREP
jgi:uncharacterized repeat protein (TIGR03847 family)